MNETRRHEVSAILRLVGNYLEEENWDAVIANLSYIFWPSLFEALAEAGISPFSTMQNVVGAYYINMPRYIKLIINGDVSYIRASYFFTPATVSPDGIEAVNEVMKLFKIFNIYAQYDDEDIVIDYFYAIRDLPNLGNNIKAIRKGI